MQIKLFFFLITLWGIGHAADDSSEHEPLLCTLALCGNADQLALAPDEAEGIEKNWLKEGFPVRLISIQNGQMSSLSYNVHDSHHRVKYTMPLHEKPLIQSSLCGLRYNAKYTVFWEEKPLDQPLIECLRDQFLLGYELKENHYHPPVPGRQFFLSSKLLKNYKRCSFYSGILRSLIKDTFPKLEKTTSHDGCPKLSKTTWDAITPGWFSSLRWSVVNLDDLESAVRTTEHTPLVFIVVKNAGILKGVMETNLFTQEDIIPTKSLLKHKRGHVAVATPEKYAWSEQRS